MESATQGAFYTNTRTIGLVYLLYFVSALVSTFLMKGIVVPDNAAATASGIVMHEAWYRSGFAAGLIANALYIAVTALFFGLFSRVNRSVSLMAAFFGLAGCTVQLIGGIFQWMPLVLLGDSQWQGGFTAEQLQTGALLSLRFYAEIFNISLVLFALYDLLLGYLIIRSKFLPKTLGALMGAAGVGWLVFLWPPLASTLSLYVMPLGALAEVALMLWLIARAPSANPGGSGAQP